MGKDISRRKALKNLGLFASSALAIPAFGFNEQGHKIHLPDQLDFTPPKPVSVITLGAGSRGNVYGDYSTKYPEQLNVVGVAEPIQIRNDRYAAKHDIKDEHRFDTWERVFERPKFADAILISTPDDLHYGPCMAAIAQGYDILLEKPISPTEQECRDILAAAERGGNIIAVCHVLRYAPYFIELRKRMHSGALGKIMSVQHFEPIQHRHMAHSFVRGNWHDSKATAPIILAKSCHDLDIMRWLIDSPCQQITAFGDLSWFKAEHKPEGATARCMGGCKVERTCPYSAKRIYLEDREYIYVFDLPENEAEHGAAIKTYLDTTNYGRCVYDMENDQPDHYTANLKFANGVTATFNMEAFTSYHGRRTRVMGTHGDIVGDMSKFVHTDFLTGKQETWEMTTDGHGGGDWNLVADWIKAVSMKDKTVLTSTIQASVESHLMGFAAEESRLNNKIAEVKV